MADKKLIYTRKLIQRESQFDLEALILCAIKKAE